MDEKELRDRARAWVRTHVGALLDQYEKNNEELRQENERLRADLETAKANLQAERSEETKTTLQRAAEEAIDRQVEAEGVAKDRRQENEHLLTALGDCRSTEAEAHTLLNGRVHCVDQEFPLLMRIKGLVDYYNKLGEHVESLTVERDRLRSRLERAERALRSILKVAGTLHKNANAEGHQWESDDAESILRLTHEALREFDAAGDRTGERDGYTPEMFREARRRHAEEQAGAWSEDGGKDE